MQTLYSYCVIARLTLTHHKENTTSHLQLGEDPSRDSHHDCERREGSFPALEIRPPLDTYPDIVGSELAAHPRVEAAVLVEAAEGDVCQVRGVVRGQAAHLTQIMPV